MFIWHLGSNFWKKKHGNPSQVHSFRKLMNFESSLQNGIAESLRVPFSKISALIGFFSFFPAGVLSLDPRVNLSPEVLRDVTHLTVARLHGCPQAVPTQCQTSSQPVLTCSQETCALVSVTPSQTVPIRPVVPAGHMTARTYLGHICPLGHDLLRKGHSRLLE